MDLGGFVQTRPWLLTACTWVMNIYDPRNWYFTLVLHLFDAAVTASSLYYNWESWPAVGLMLFNAALLFIKIPFMWFYYKYAVQRYSEFQTLFKELDGNKKGYLTPSEADELVKRFPEGTFESEFSSKLKQISLDVVVWCTTKHRILFYRLMEFTGAFAMFFASLMLFTPGGEVNAIIFVQGVQSALSMALMLSDVLEEHAKKYHATSASIQLCVNVGFAFMLIALLAVLLSGYAVVAKLYEDKYTLPFNITKTFPQDDGVGAVGGAIITAIVVVMLSIYLGLFWCGGKCGACDVFVEHFGEDDPIKLLRKRAYENRLLGMEFKKPRAGTTTTTAKKEESAAQAPPEFATVVPPPPPPPPAPAAQQPSERDLQVV